MDKLSVTPSSAGVNATRGPDKQALEALARENLRRLVCTGCHGVGLASDGKTQGRLRIRCRECDKSVYADQHPTVLNLAAGDITPNQGQIPPVDKTVKSMLLFNELNNSDIGLDDESMDDGPPCTVEEQLNYLLATGEDLQEEVASNNQAINAKVDRLFGMFENISKQLEVLTRVVAKSTSPPGLETKPTPPVYQAQGPVYHNHGPASHGRAPAQDPAPWKTAVSHYRPPAPQEKRPSASPNRFQDLSESIPAYRGKTEAQYDIEQFNRRKNQRGKIRGNLTVEQIQRIKKGLPARGLSPMVTLHFEGMQRNRIVEIKSMFKSIGIEPRWVRNISFIGRSIMELITFEDKKLKIISLLENHEITWLEKFNPVSIDNIKNDTKYSGLTIQEKEILAKKLYTTRLQKTYDRLPKDGIHNRMRNYLNLQLNPKQKRATGPEDTLENYIKAQETVVEEQATTQEVEDPVNIAPIDQEMQMEESESEGSSSDLDDPNPKRKVIALERYDSDSTENGVDTHSP